MVIEWQKKKRNQTRGLIRAREEIARHRNQAIWLLAPLEDDANQQNKVLNHI